MKLYAESSALLAWLLGEPAGEEVRALLAGAEVVVASELTVIECERVLIRGAALGEFTEAAAAVRHAALSAAAVRWHILLLGGDITARARRPFPREPVRTLDALHLASALIARAAFPDLRLLALDQRVRSNARLLGLTCAPDEPLCL